VIPPDLQMWRTPHSRFSYGAAILGCEKAAEWQQALLLAMDAKRGVEPLCNAVKKSGEVM